VPAIAAKFGLHAGSMEFSTHNEELISIRIINCMQGNQSPPRAVALVVVVVIMIVIITCTVVPTSFSLHHVQ
jgi:hypothetical protein